MDIDSSRKTEYESLIEAMETVGGSWGVFIQDMNRDEPLFKYNADGVFPAASVIKVPILVELYRQSIEEGLDLAQPIQMNGSFHTQGSGILSRLSQDLTITLGDLARFMIELSDNTATNVLISQLDKEKINTTAHRYGLTHTHLWLDRIEINQLSEQPNRLATTTPRDMALLFKLLGQGDILTARACKKILTLLMHSSNTRRICGQLPFRSDLYIYHKTGTLNGVFNDVGLVCFTGGTYVISVFCEDVTASNDPRTPNEAETIIAQLSRLTFEVISQQNQLVQPVGHI